MKHLRLARIGLVLLLLVLGFAGLSSPASAAGAAPANLQVGTSFTPYGGAIVALPSVPFSVAVVGVANSIPVADCPYKGYHLDYDKSLGNGCDGGGTNPETNSITGVYTDGGPDVFLGNPYSKKFFGELIWCGQAGGITEGNFKVQVTVNPGANKNQITYDGVTKTGKWKVLAVENGGNNSLVIADDSNVAQAVAYNPYTTSVLFNFIEDPPPPGTLKTTKYEVDSAGTTIALANSAAAVTSSAIKYYYSNTNLFFPTGTESGTTNTVERDRIDTTVNPFGADVVVPSGYKLLRASTSNPFNTNATATCTGAAQTGTCKVIGIQVVPNTTTRVEFFIQRLPSAGALSCSTTENGKNYFTGWGIDKDAQGSSPTIGIYEGGILKQTVFGNVLNSDYNALLKALGYATNAATQYNIKTELGLLFHDGLVHNSVTAKINEQTFAVQPFGGPTANCGGVVTKYLWPWLQTTNGNVVANGKIIGNTAGGTLPGARVTSDKEVEFLIISKVGGGGPFCSLKNYILTNASATTGDCGNGSGYKVLNVYSLVDGGTDKVVAGVKAAYNDLPAACKTDTALVSGIPTSVDLAACPNGIIVKYTGTNLGSYSLTKGRVTILVERDLTIGQNIGYGTTAYTNPRDVPNLAIVVKGNVKILAATPQVDASIYATGTISTCDTAPAKFCGYQLTINGFLSAQSGFIFGRAYILGYNGQAVPPHDPAEKINLTLQSVLYPPPGIDYGSVFKGDSSVKIDSSEYQPRF